MKFKFLKSIAFILLLTFSFHQFSFAYFTPTASLQPPAINHQAFTSFQDQSISVSEHANSAQLVSDGNWKGLLKYWGITALQIGIQAVLFALPGAGAAIGSAFQSFGRTILGHLGKGIISSVAHSIGNVFNFIGSKLGGFLAPGAGSVKSGGFSLIKDSLSKGFSNFANQINPLTYYSNIFTSLTTNLKSVSGFTKLLTSVAEKLSLQIGTQKLDQTIGKSKLGIFTQALLSTVSSIGIQAIGSGLFSTSQTSLEATGSRAPPTGLAGIFSKVTSAVSSLGGIITNGLKDAAGFVKSLFVQDQNSLSPNAKILFDPQGEVNFYNPSNDGLDLNYAAELGFNSAQFDLDEGIRQYLSFDSQTKAVTSSERVGNSLGSFNDFRLNLADSLDQGIDFGINQILGTPHDNPLWIFSAATLYTAGDLLKGYTDSFRLGTDVPDIISSFKAGLKSGEFGKAALNFLFYHQPLAGNTPNLNRAGALSLNELGRASILLTPFAGVLKGAGALRSAGVAEGILEDAGRIQLRQNLIENRAVINASKYPSRYAIEPRTTGGIPLNKLTTGTKDLRGELERIKRANEIYENLQDSSTAEDIADAFEIAMRHQGFKDLLRKGTAFLRIFIRKITNG